MAVFYKITKKFISSSVGALYFLKITSILSIAQLVGALSAWNLRIEYAREMVCNGFATGVLAVGGYLLLKKLKKDSEM